MTDINEKLNIIIQRLDNVQDQITEIHESNDKMNNHIDFVNSVFNIVRIPFFTLMSMTSRLLPTNETIADESYLGIKVD